MYRVIFVDDEDIEREAMAAIIPWEQVDMELADMAWNGVEGLEKIRMHRPDVVITDIKMPGMDGIELMKKVLEVRPYTSFVILTNYAEFSYAREAVTTSREGLSISETVEVFPEVAREPYQEMLINFADSVRTGAKLIVPGQEAEGALELSNAAYLSAWTGQPAALPVDGERFEALLKGQADA